MASKKKKGQQAASATAKVSEPELTTNGNDSDQLTSSSSPKKRSRLFMDLLNEKYPILASGVRRNTLWPPLKEKLLASFDAPPLLTAPDTNGTTSVATASTIMPPPTSAPTTPKAAGRDKVSHLDHAVKSQSVYAKSPVSPLSSPPPKKKDTRAPVKFDVPDTLDPNGMDLPADEEDDDGKTDSTQQLENGIHLGGEGDGEEESPQLGNNNKTTNNASSIDDSQVHEVSIVSDIVGNTSAAIYDDETQVEDLQNMAQVRTRFR